MQETDMLKHYLSLSLSCAKFPNL